MAQSWSAMTLTEKIFAVRDPLSWLFSNIGITTPTPAGQFFKFAEQHPVAAAFADDPITAIIKWIYNKPLVNTYRENWKKFLENTWKIDSSFSQKAADLILALNQARISFTITSGWRSQELQQKLYDEWLRGNKTVYTPAKPGNSLHQHTTWWGGPASLAIDISTSNPQLAGQIAARLGIWWAGMKDPVHFATRAGGLNG